MAGAGAAGRAEAALALAGSDAGGFAVKLLGRLDTGSIEPSGHVGADAWNIFQLNAQQRCGHVGGMPDHQSVAVAACRFLARLARHLGQLAVGRNTN